MLAVIGHHFLNRAPRRSLRLQSQKHTCSNILWNLFPNKTNDESIENRSDSRMQMQKDCNAAHQVPLQGLNCSPRATPGKMLWAFLADALLRIRGSSFGAAQLLLEWIEIRCWLITSQLTLAQKTLFSSAAEGTHLIHCSTEQNKTLSSSKPKIIFVYHLKHQITPISSKASSLLVFQQHLQHCHLLDKLSINSHLKFICN